MTKIYTEAGDNGTTSLADGSLVSKDSERIETCGSVDELNAFLGLAAAYINHTNPVHTRLVRVQQELMLLNSQIALASETETITMINVRNLEQEIDEMNFSLLPLNEFIISDGNKTTAHLHVARTVCRRAERQVVKLKPNKTIKTYLNRLSDWLFITARFMEEKHEQTA